LFRATERVTTTAARPAEVPYGIAEGKPAKFVVFDCADEAEAIRLRQAARLVVCNGGFVAETDPARSVVHVDGRHQPVTFRRSGVGSDTVGAGGGISGTDGSTPQMAGAGPNRAW